MRLVAAFACAVMLICLGVAQGHADKRVALVIGNSAYRVWLCVASVSRPSLRLISTAPE
jgi:hypothetical protein